MYIHEHFSSNQITTENTAMEVGNIRLNPTYAGYLLYPCSSISTCDHHYCFLMKFSISAIFHHLKYDSIDEAAF